MADPAPSDGPSAVSDPAHEAMAAVQVGLYVSALRCLLTYVVAPAAGAAGVLLGPIGLVLLLLGAVTSTAGARRLWALGHRARIPYVAIALAVWTLAAASVVQLVIGVLR